MNTNPANQSVWPNTVRYLFHSPRGHCLCCTTWQPNYVSQHGPLIASIVVNKCFRALSWVAISHLDGIRRYKPKLTCTAVRDAVRDAVRGCFWQRDHAQFYRRSFVSDTNFLRESKKTTSTTNVSHVCVKECTPTQHNPWLSSPEWLHFVDNSAHHNAPTQQQH